MKDDTETLLLEYLQAARESDIAGTLKHVANWTTSHEAKDDLRHEEIKGALRGHSLRIGTLEKNDDKIDERLDQSGSWQVEAVKARAIMAEESSKWWKEKAITVIVGLVMLILGGAGTFLFHK